MDPLAEGQMRLRVFAAKVELPRIGELLRVAIGGREAKMHHCAFRDAHTAQLGILRRDAEETLARRFEAQHLLDEILDEVRPPAKLCQNVSTLRKNRHARAERAGRGFVTADDEMLGEADFVGEAHVAAIGHLCIGKVGQYVLGRLRALPLHMGDQIFLQRDLFLGHYDLALLAEAVGQWLDPDVRPMLDAVGVLEGETQEARDHPDGQRPRDLLHELTAAFGHGRDQLVDRGLDESRLRLHPLGRKGGSHRRSIAGVTRRVRGELGVAWKSLRLQDRARLLMLDELRLGESPHVDGPDLRMGDDVLNVFVLGDDVGVDLRHEIDRRLLQQRRVVAVGVLLNIGIHEAVRGEVHHGTHTPLIPPDFRSRATSKASAAASSAKRWVMMLRPITGVAPSSAAALSMSRTTPARPYMVEPTMIGSLAAISRPGSRTSSQEAESSSSLPFGRSHAHASADPETLPALSIATSYSPLGSPAPSTTTRSVGTTPARRMP